MSLESALDEERREVMNILEGRAAKSQTSPTTLGYGQIGHPSNPAPQIRSMLDVGPAGPRRSSLAGPAASAIAPPVRSTPVIRSMLDPQSSPPPRVSQSVTTSPASNNSFDGATHHRAQSDASIRSLSNSRPRASSDLQNDGAALPYAGNQFEMSSNVQGPSLPKRVTQGGKKGLGISSMASIIQGQELEPQLKSGDRGRHNSTASILGGIGGKSKSPSSRLNPRSQSPGGTSLSSSFNVMPVPGKFVTPGGAIIDMNNAYRRLSDANLLKSGGHLSNIPTLKGKEGTRVGSGESLSPTGEVRLQKDYYRTGGSGGAVIESSDESDSTDDDDAWGPTARGRKKVSRKKRVDSEAKKDSKEGNSSSGPAGMGRAGGPRAVRSLLAAAEEERISVSAKTNAKSRSKAANIDIDNSENDKPPASGPAGMGRSAGPRMARSLLGAAEEERLSIASKYKVKSLIDPAITVNGPNGEKLSAERLSRRNSGVHPNTNYNSQISGASSPATSDSEDLSDIRRAQRLTINQSPVDSSVQHRVIRTIVRGEYSRMVEEAEAGSRRIRKYLVATDLSSEAAYALEWTIGTVLRDGDSLFAIYAVDEEVGTKQTGESEPMEGLPVGQGGAAMQETAEMVDRMTAATQNKISKINPSPLASPAMLLDGKESRAASADSRSIPRADQERFHAIELISQTCIKFLRKTRLQVRVGVEVIHCKSPKHMITEAIDVLDPTLVILGSRGRSALKGVLLGSFSNYLVTKSSVPVMVARKKLQKPSSKNRLPHSRLVNNLTPSKSLAEAKID
ncbi:hypothetical protein MMC34_002499 [Xylographa carneopallida]|nr:hypothetical protein [Xylographa carneopallida]